MSICELTTFDKICWPSSMMAAAVSSQELSIPRMRIISAYYTIFYRLCTVVKVAVLMLKLA